MIDPAEALLEFSEDYLDTLKEENVNDVLKNLKARKKQQEKHEMQADLERNQPAFVMIATIVSECKKGKSE